MKPDDVLRAVAGTGGVIGMSAAPHTTLSAAHPRHSIESVMDHFRYCIDLVGIDHVAFGPDTLSTATTSSCTRPSPTCSAWTPPVGPPSSPSPTSMGW